MEVQKPRVCPCGNRIEKKPKESPSQFEKRNPLYCCVQCKGKYHKHPRAKRAFGLEVPTGKRLNRIGPGINAFIDAPEKVWT